MPRTGPTTPLYDRPAMLALAGDVSGRTVLDAACGPGLYVEQLVRRGAKVIGFDQSPALVELARQRVGSAADLRVHDLTQPLSWVADASIHLVVCALALHYVDDRVTTLGEFRRLLSAGGAVIVSTTHPTSAWLRLGGSYFTIEAAEESLSPRHDWPVRAWRLPLTAMRPTPRTSSGSSTHPHSSHSGSPQRSRLPADPSACGTPERCRKSRNEGRRDRRLSPGVMFGPGPFRRCDSVPCGSWHLVVAAAAQRQCR